MPVVTIFGDGKIDESNSEYFDAMKTGEIFAINKWDIATGAYSGIMEAPLKGAAGYCIKRIGITLKEYTKSANIYVNEEIATNHYLERLSKLIEIGDAFIAFSGATGTLLEITAYLALRQRNLLNYRKHLFCVGRKWKKITTLFDNKEIIHQNINFCEKGVDAAEKIINSYKR